MENENSNNEPVVFYDGVCGVCDRSIQLLLKIDKKNILRYAPLQGVYASKILPSNLVSDLTTVVFIKNNNVYIKLDAAIEILRSIGGFWALAKAGYLVPKFIRNRFYNFLSKNRYRIFGKRTACRLLSIEEKKLFFE